MLLNADNRFKNRKLIFVIRKIQELQTKDYLKSTNLKQSHLKTRMNNGKTKMIFCVLIKSAMLISMQILLEALFFHHYCSAEVLDRKNILSIDLLDYDNVLVLSQYLNKKDDILNYLAVRQRLFSLSLPELREIQNSIRKRNPMIDIGNLIEKVIAIKEDTFLLREEFFLNNIPLLIDSPFYGNDRETYNIRELKPHAEQLYFSNLKLNFKKKSLFLREADDLWLDPKIARNAPREEGVSILELSKKVQGNVYKPLSTKAAKLWTYEIKDDYMHNFFINNRQWIKKYEEDLTFPVFYQNTVIIRNEYRLFCIDVLSGKELWSLGNSAKHGQENHHSFFHPHQNSYGHELLISNEILFSELDRRLVAVNLKDALHPKLIWECELGEYTVCTKPIRAKDTLIIGIINARGELWFCGFNCQKGNLEWNTYIGTSSFLSPVCVISDVEGSNLVIGTNHGALACINPHTGNILWLRKYTPKNYNLFNYWDKGGYKDNYLNKGSIKYDTQFIKIESNNGQCLYYKPRESDYLYILDSRSGELKEKVLIDSQKFYILGVCDGKAVFLERKTDLAENTEIKVVDLSSGTVVYNKIVSGNVLKGVIYPNKDELLFKINDTAHLFKIQNNDVMHAQIDIPIKGWLVANEGRFLLVADDRTLSCLDIFDPGCSYDLVGDPYGKYVMQREKIKDALSRNLQGETGDKEVLASNKQLLSEIIESKINLSEIYPILRDNLENLRDPSWSGFVEQLQKLHGEEIIIYQDVEISFSNFIFATGCGKQPYTPKGSNAHIKNDHYDNSMKDVQIKLNGLGDSGILPIEIIKGPQLLNFFLLLNPGQLLCISKNGDILWERKLFVGPFWTSTPQKRPKRHLYAPSSIMAYLYNDILILNDYVDIIAIDVNSGNYIWSMTNKRGLFREEKQNPPLNAEWTYEAGRWYIQNIMFYSKFLNGKLIVIHGNKIYSLDPLTGFCESYKEMDVEGVMEVGISEGLIYLLPYSLNNIKVLNQDLEIIASFPLDFMDRNKDVWPDILFLANYLVLHAKPDVYILDKRNGKLINKLDTSHFEQYLLDTCNNNILIIEPFKKVTSYHVSDYSFAINWEFDSAPVDSRSIWGVVSEGAKFYFIIDKNIWLVIKRRGEYFIVSLDFDTGQKVWESRLDQVKGFFCGLSNFKNIDETINFVITTTYVDVYNEEDNLLEKIIDFSTTITDAKLFSIDIKNGNIIKIDRLPSINMSAFKTVITEVGEYVLCSVYGRFLEYKNKEDKNK